MTNTFRFFLIGFIMLELRAQISFTPCKGKDDCCDGILCGINEGDCDSDENCAGHLRCGVDNCIGSDFDSTDDCCWEDPMAIPETTISKGPEKCNIGRGLFKKYLQAAVTQGCDLPKGSKFQMMKNFMSDDTASSSMFKPGIDTISMEECSQVSCSAEFIGKSFACNKKNKRETCKELLTILDIIGNTECTQLLRSDDGVTIEDSFQDWLSANAHCQLLFPAGIAYYQCIFKANTKKFIVDYEEYKRYQEYEQRNMFLNEGLFEYLGYSYSNYKNLNWVKQCNNAIDGDGWLCSRAAEHFINGTDDFEFGTRPSLGQFSQEVFAEDYTHLQVFGDMRLQCVPCAASVFSWCGVGANDQIKGMLPPHCPNPTGYEFCFEDHYESITGRYIFGYHCKYDPETGVCPFMSDCTHYECWQEGQSDSHNDLWKNCATDATNSTYDADACENNDACHRDVCIPSHITNAIQVNQVCFEHFCNGNPSNGWPNAICREYCQEPINMREPFCDPFFQELCNPDNNVNINYVTGLVDWTNATFKQNCKLNWDTNDAYYTICPDGTKPNFDQKRRAGMVYCD